MTSIKSIALKLNDLASNYEIGKFQECRKHLKNLTKPNTYKIFSGHTIKDNYTYHSGGRGEIQYNIGYDKRKGEDIFRYGLAFALQRSQWHHNVVDELKPTTQYENVYVELSHNYLSMHTIAVRVRILRN